MTLKYANSFFLTFLFSLFPLREQVLKYIQRQGPSPTREFGGGGGGGGVESS